MAVKQWLSLGLMAAFSASAQMDSKRDWQETAAPAPPAFSKSQLIPIEMPPYVTLSLGVDPDTLSITTDGVIRYVVVATNAGGSSNAMYEGLRCATGEVRSYARQSTDGEWSLLEAPWQRLNDMPSRHAQALAAQGFCEGGGSTPARTVNDIVRTLKNRNPALSR
ncbi:MAG: hypothetical protein ACI9I0_002423 [Rhodoferax sp.]|jgi:hypothetical protein